MVHAHISPTSAVSSNIKHDTHSYIFSVNSGSIQTVMKKLQKCNIYEKKATIYYYLELNLGQVPEKDGEKFTESFCQTAQIQT